MNNGKEIGSVSLLKKKYIIKVIPRNPQGYCYQHKFKSSVVSFYRSWGSIFIGLK